MDSTMRHDMQNVLDWYKNRLVQRLIVSFPTRQELQAMSDQARDRILACLQSLMQQQQQSLRQIALVADNQVRRTTSLENRLVGLEQSLQSMQQMMMAIIENQKQLSGAPSMAAQVLEAEASTDPGAIFRYSNA